MQQLTAWLWQLAVQAALKRVRRVNAALGATGR
jgi:hypothetical protein